MSHWIQMLLVTLAVVASAFYAAYILMPSSMRLRLDAVLDRVLPQYLRRRRAARLSGCSDCVRNPKAPRPETRIAVHQIGRRD